MCPFCGKSHPNGITKELEAQGHPYLVTSRQHKGDAWAIRGQEVSDAEYETAKKKWKELRA